MSMDFKGEPDNEKILSDHIPTAIGEYLRVCGKDLKHNNFILLSEAADRIQELEAENERLQNERIHQ